MFPTKKIDSNICKDYKNLEVKLITNFNQAEFLRCFYLKVFPSNGSFAHDAEAIILKDEMKEKSIVPDTIQTLSHSVLGNWEIIKVKQTSLLKVAGIVLYLKMKAPELIEPKAFTFPFGIKNGKLVFN